MKTINFFLYSSLLLLLFVGCSKDSDSGVVSSFPFELTESHSESSTVNQPQNSVLTIIPEKTTDGNQFSFKYEILKGEASFTDANGEPVQAEKFIILDALKTTFFFIGKSVGEVKVRWYVKDGQGKEESIDLTYIVQHNSFSFDFTSDIQDTKLQAPTPIVFKLDNSGNDPSVTYKRSFSISEGDFELFVGGTNNAIALDDKASVNEGTQNIDIKFKELGDAAIECTVTDSNGQTVSKTLSFTVSEVGVSFNAQPQESSIYEGQSNTIVFLVEEDSPLGGDYRIKYQVNSGDVDLTFGNQPLFENVFYDVPLGQFQFNAFSPDTGSHEIIFTLEDEFGAQIVQEVAYDVIGYELNLSVTQSLDSQNITLPVDIQIDVTDIPEPAPPYTISYSTTNIGNIYFDDQLYAPGDSFVVNTASFNLEYIGDLAGIHEVTFTVENQSGAINQAIAQIEYLASDFEFIAELQSPNNTLVNNGQFILHRNINLQVNPFGEGQSFTYKYVVNEGNPNVKYKLFPDDSATILAPNQEVPFQLDNNDNLASILVISCQPNISENIVITVIATSDSDVFYAKQFNFVANP